MAGTKPPKPPNCNAGQTGGAAVTHRNAPDPLKTAPDALL